MFNLKVGNVGTFVGMQIERDRSNKSIFIHQTAYTLRIIERFKMMDANLVSVPADSHTILTDNDQDTVNVSYREAIGSLMFLVLVTRPDIAFAVNVVSRYVNNHKNNHWMAVKRIFKYLLNTIGCGLLYENQDKNNEVLVGYSDALCRRYRYT